jgi:uncharacterized protein YdeI (BOF family)
MMRQTLVLVVCAAWLAGCGEKKVTVLGVAPSGGAQSIMAAKTAEDNAVVTVEGTMVEKCPAAGCWFVIRDGTGMIKVDTKLAGFVVLDVPLNTRLTVSGRWAAPEAERVLQAIGLRY